jgi:hypothetical protein
MTNEKKSKKKKKKGYVPRPIGKGEMVDVGRTFHTIPNIIDFEKEVMRISKRRYVIASHVKISHGGIYKATVMMNYQGQMKEALFLLVRRTVMGQQQFQMTRMFIDNDKNEGGICDLLALNVKGIELHVQW